MNYFCYGNYFDLFYICIYFKIVFVVFFVAFIL